ncbi:RNA-directed DNA polymerase [Azospirillum sp. YIM DDC1]|uniref:RNA-directed DNA polymerase n=1 Tax=Azospirillum aestuarii TaxID=2802052 RepID=A0ABS1I504_9PROT|nr:RNA-directed DNA polymerase [Azospirillum aestuarii]MBK4722107.1 RNA-directed DNA polymerase [Azospirillum aestuarii]
MKRSAVGLAEIADWHTLAAAFHRAARGKGRRDEVRCFRAALMDELSGLRRDILDGTVAVGQTRRFRIRDPKPRVIHAPCFRERVLHHAVMAHAGPVLERGLVDDTFACRPGKGTLAAVRRAAHHADRFPWYGQIDIRSYFAGIDHGRLLRLLGRRFKDAGLLALFARIVDAHHDSPGKGLPIGALTSQHFANAYLGGLDRFLLERCKVRGMVRSMDDLVWWGDDKAAVRAVMADVRHYVGDELDLAVKEPVRIGRSRPGLAFCGYRVVPGRLLLSRRRKRRYAIARRRWEAAFLAGRIGAREVQAGCCGALAITAHAEAAAWRREHLRRRPLADALDRL